MMEYGFVYLWFDRKRKMYYIGSHWGTETDGYVCSSDRMKKIYRRRSFDFKRRILARIYSDRTTLYEIETIWLSKIKNEELNVKYYNLSKKTANHWASSDRDRLTIGQKISRAKTGKSQSSIQAVASRNNLAKGRYRLSDRDVRMKIALGNKGRDNTKASMISAESRRGKPLSPEHKLKCKLSALGKPKSETHKANMRKPKQIIVCPHCQKSGGKPAMIKHHFDNCKQS